MFETFGLVDLGRRAGWDIGVREGGWKGCFSFPTAEAVVSRRHGTGLRGLQFATAKREKGVPECVGMYQVKWGTNIFPKDEIPLSALLRSLIGGLGIIVPGERCVPIGTLGPWTYKSTIALCENILVLTVIDEQAEMDTPFYASLFHVDVTGLGDGKVSDAFSDLRWMPFEELIVTHGGSVTCIYWQMFFMAMEKLVGRLKPDSFFSRTWGPGKYTLLLS